MAFAFDPKAALAARRNRDGGLATTATVATETGEAGALVATVATVATGPAPERNSEAATDAGAPGFSEREPRARSAAGGAATAATTATEAAGLSQLSRLSQGPVADAADPDTFEDRAAIAEHDGGMTRAEAERLADGDALGFEAPVAAAADIPDPARLTALLAEHGPMTQGAAGAALGWGATRAWQAEAALRERRLADFDHIGRAAIAEAWEAFKRANDPMDPEAWR